MRGLGSGSYITEETLRVALAAVGMDDDPTDPEQWRSYFYSQPPESAEKALWRAVLERAISDYKGRFEHCRSDASRNAVNAETWLFDTSMEVGSFTFCCQLLGLSPYAVRRRLLCNRTWH